MRDEMLDPMNAARRDIRVARVGHFARHEQLHLLLVIERRADLQLRGGFGADAMGEVVQTGLGSPPQRLPSFVSRVHPLCCSSHATRNTLKASRWS